MDPKVNFKEELSGLFDNASGKQSFFLTPESSDKDIEEILHYLTVIVETALKRNRITEAQGLACKENVSKISAALQGIKTAPQLKADMLLISTEQLLQSLLSYSEASARAMLERAGKGYVELNPSNGAITVCFLYTQLAGDATYFDHFANSKLPVNGDATYCCYDNYLPVYKLMQKYFPESTIRLINDSKQAHGKYIYVVTFKQFLDFSAKNGLDLLAVIPANILNDCQNGKAIIVYNDLDGCTFYPLIIDNFIKQLQKAKVIDSFYVLSGDLANEVLKNPGATLQKVLHFFNPGMRKLNLYTVNYFEEAMAYSQIQKYPKYDYLDKLNLIKSNTSRLKHFICLNKTVKDYRLYLSYFFFANNLMDKAFVSQDRYTGPKDFQFGYNKNTAFWNDVQDVGFEKFKQSLPWRIDYDETKSFEWDDVPIDTLNSSFCWIVTETSFGDTLPEQSFRLTEKAYKPCAFFMPFIMVGNPFTLKRLRQDGYQTFSRWWDEGYDGIIDPIQRMEAINRVILKISAFSQQELVRMYEEMKPVLLHNHKLLINSHSGNLAMQAIYDGYVAL